MGIGDWYPKKRQGLGSPNFDSWSIEGILHIFRQKQLKSSLLFNAAARAISRCREPSARQALQSARSLCLKKSGDCENAIIKPWWKGDLWWKHQVRDLHGGLTIAGHLGGILSGHLALLLKIAIEIVGLPIKNCDFPLFFACLPGEFPFFCRPWPGPLRSPPLRDHSPEGHRAEQRPLLLESPNKK